MVRVWVAAGLAVLGIVAAVLAAGGLPWSLRPVSASAALTEPALAPVVATPDAREVTDLALRQLRQGRGGDSPDAMQALTRTVVRDLRRSAGTSALEHAVRRAAEAGQADAYVAALLAEAQKDAAPGNVTRTSGSVASKLSDIIARPVPRP
jgi:cobalamin biosynthesis protein CobD/CbiB